MLAGAGASTYVRVRNASSPAFLKRSPQRWLSSSSDRSWAIPTASAILFAMNSLASTSTRRGQEWRIRYLIDEQDHTVVVLDVSHRSVTYGT
jgi:hypothetical protein